MIDVAFVASRGMRSTVNVNQKVRQPVSSDLSGFLLALSYLATQKLETSCCRELLQGANDEVVRFDRPKPVSMAHQATNRNGS